MILHTERTKPCLVELPLTRSRIADPLHLPAMGVSVEAYVSDGIYFIECREKGRLKFRQSFPDGGDFFDRWKEIESGKLSAKGA